MTQTRTSLTLFSHQRWVAKPSQTVVAAQHLQQRSAPRRSWQEMDTERRRRAQEIARPVRVNLLVRVWRLWA